jgi:alkanesulfonate monooxygenase SsuD/methylene tetrahydromethanopterin reductase-like flavin-dependent oxidoreductase (luciferase family)
MEHDTRYDYAAEWIEIMKLLWTREEEFDYEGRFLRVKKGFAQPKPVQRPFPPLMNAGSSGKGREFAAKYADMVFVSVGTSSLEDTKALIASYKKMARESHGRDIQVWSNAHVTQRETMQEAEDIWRYFVVERGDDAAVDNLMGVQKTQMQRLLTQEERERRLLLKGGWGGYKLVGTPDHIADGLARLSAVGFDGVLLSWLDYRDGLARFGAEVAPRLVQAGLRH